ncbi:FeoA family protein [Lacticaseibacillus mingshuiensis]|uniref:Ferrous iron transport protein A n=1 Tax=Lacticaseibacillus mingshuiensis TaxID=2799574 RepID=A0ABW4CJN1_9LACO|nr:ferrous iron transport protein A [Lacticaseibacillus mingshuiensis]
MQTLTDVPRPGAFIILGVTGRPALVRHLAEMGLLVGKRITVIQTADGPTGMLVFFQGQRLAISNDIAANIQVAPLTAAQLDDAVPLAGVPVHRSAIVAKLTGTPALRQRLMDMGLTRGTMVTVHQVAPLGDPLELIVRGYKLSLRKADAASVLVAEVDAHD